MATFAAHGLRIVSDIPLSLASPPSVEVHSAPLIQIVRCDARQIPVADSSNWLLRDTGHLDVAYTGGTMLLSSYCGSRAAFQATASDYVISVSRGPSISTERYCHTVLHAFLPNALACWGMPMIHTCSVVIDGKAVLLSGPSGAGKSTLAAGFLRRGSTVLSDDVVRLQRQGDGYVAWPSYPGSRLRSGSFLLPENVTRGAAGRFGLPKHRVHTESTVDHSGYPVAAMLFLGRSRSPRPRLEPLSGGELLNEWLDASFLQALPRDRFARESFGTIGAVAKLVPAWRLRYKRSAAHFDQLLDGIVELVRGLPK